VRRAAAGESFHLHQGQNEAAARMEHSRAHFSTLLKFPLQPANRRCEFLAALLAAGVLCCCDEAVVCLPQQAPTSPPWPDRTHARRTTTTIHHRGRLARLRRSHRAVFESSSRGRQGTPIRRRTQIGPILGASCEKGADSELSSSSLAAAGAGSRLNFSTL
jgi:hypothetical protein